MRTHHDDGIPEHRWSQLADCFAQMSTPAMRRYVAVILTVCFVVFGMSVKAQASDEQDKRDKDEIARLRVERKELAKEKAKAAAHIDALEVDVVALQQAITVVEDYIKQVEENVRSVQMLIENAQKDREEAEKQAKELRDKIETIRLDLQAKAIEVFMAPPPSATEQLAIADLGESAVKLYLLDHVFNNELDITDELRASQDRLKLLERLARERQEYAQKEQAELEKQLRELEQLRADHERLKEEFDKRKELWRSESAAIQAASDDIGSDIARLQANIDERKRIREAEEAAKRAAARRRAEEARQKERREARKAAGEFVVEWPVRPPTVTSGYGPRRHPIFGVVRPHNGIDIDGDTGDPVKASYSGKVIIATYRTGYGNTVVIDHGLGRSTLYAHLHKINVRVGQSVDSGQLIGTVGSTGWSTGPHLHFEVRIDGRPEDPRRYLL